MNKVLIQCIDLEQYFMDAGNKVEIFKGLNLTVRAGEHIAITGASGSGKSTLLNLLGGLEAPKSGKILIDGQDLNLLSTNKLAKFRNQNIGFIYQFHHLLGEFSAVENVAMPLLIRGHSPRQAEQMAKEMLSQVGLSHRFSHRPAALSGGERQRTAIARALVTLPKCLLADEPTGNLDTHTAHMVYQLLLDLNRQFNITLILVTHDHQIANAMQFCYHLNNGKLEN